MTWTLLASAPTVEGIERQIRRFWASDAYSVDPGTLQIVHSTRRVPDDYPYRVARVRNRYRFEARS